MQPHLSKRLKISIIVVILVVISLAVGSGFSKSRDSANSEIFDGLQLSLLRSLIKFRQYVEEVQPKKLIYGAIKGMVFQTLDPYSQFRILTSMKNWKLIPKANLAGWESILS